MQAKCKLIINPSPLLGNDDSSKVVPGYNPGHTLGTGVQKFHRSLEDFASSLYLEAQTPMSMSAVQFIDVQSALFNAVLVNQELSLALKSGICNACTVSDLIYLLCTYKEGFKFSLPESLPHQQAEYRPRVTIKIPKPSSKVGTASDNTSLFTCFKCGMADHFS
ncbi:hypothetical protein DSO57_1009926 [Entomophthora muscae]|uniref:Uncharacterized protein n=1 Tax=Entomophthora muscae TaxID=34485 RepID=A0ACC2SW31_9FUNG|nr:hypothetical protein DSO57_1009926 [Entomophthora muscae]